MDFTPETAEPPIVVPEIVEEPKKPWGVWFTLLLSLGIMGVFIAVQTGVAVLCLIIAIFQGHIKPEGNPEAIQQFCNSGWLISLASWICLPCTLGAMYFFIRLRKGWTMAEYLGWNRVSLRQVCLWLIPIVALAAASDSISWWMGEPVVTEFAKEAYRTSYWPPLLWATFLIAAPLFEESLFRGFLFRGIQDSGWGSVWAVLITSVFWTAIHTQYDLFTLFHVFLIGLLLGTARAITRSTTLTMIMHFLVNLIATLEVYWFR
jgi:membrane protease YdiL (CAAX protease family)